MNIDGSNILITGASQGIGRRLAVHFAPKASEIMIAARNQTKLEETAALVQAAGGRATILPLDLCNPESIEALVKTVRLSKKQVDILINNAADATSKSLLNSSFEEIDSIIRTNVIGCLQLCRLISPILIEQKHGMIINVSSLAGYNPNGKQTAYSTSKAAINAFSEALRDELAPKGIHVMNIAQQNVLSDQPFRSFAQSLDAAIQRNEAELFLSPAKKWLIRLYSFYPELAALKKRRQRTKAGV